MTKHLVQKAVLNHSLFQDQNLYCDPWRVQVKWESGGDAHSTNSLCYDTWSSSLFECLFSDLLGRLFVVTLPLLPHKWPCWPPHTCCSLGLVQIFHLECKLFSSFKLYPKGVEGSVNMSDECQIQKKVTSEWSSIKPGLSSQWEGKLLTQWFYPKVVSLSFWILFEL